MKTRIKKAMPHVIKHANKAVRVVSAAMAVKGIAGGSILAISGASVLAERVLHGELSFSHQAIIGAVGGTVGFLISLRA